MRHFMIEGGAIVVVIV